MRQPLVVLRFGQRQPHALAPQRTQVVRPVGPFERHAVAQCTQGRAVENEAGTGAFARYPKGGAAPLSVTVPRTACADE
jgi:hypothetical protein